MKRAWLIAAVALLMGFGSGIVAQDEPEPEPGAYCHKCACKGMRDASTCTMYCHKERCCCPEPKKEVDRKSRTSAFRRL